MKVKLIATLSIAALLSVTVMGWAQDKKRDKRHKKDSTNSESATPTKAPDFTLTDLSGKKHSLKDYKDKIVVLEWTNKDCPVWRGRMDFLKKTANTYTAKGVVWLHVDSTAAMEESDNAAFMKEHEITQPVLVDRDGAVGHAYGAQTTPHMFIIDKAGKIAYRGAIDNDRGGKLGDKATNYVANALDELLADKPVTKAETAPYGCSVKYAKGKKA